MLRKTWLVLMFLLINSLVFSQMELKGIVVDAKTREPMSYVNISVSSSEGYLTDDSGYFAITVSAKTDSVIFSYLGYKDEVLRKRFFKKDSLVIRMNAEGLMLQEFTVKAKRRVKEKDTIAIRLFRAVVAHKDDNRPKSFDRYQYEEYQKTVASLYNINPNITKRKILKPFRFLFMNQDSTEEGVRFVPLILKETLTDHYFQGDPKKERSVVKGSQVSGIEQLRFADLLDVAFDEVDIYDNQALVNNAPFVLPFAPGGLTLYNYYFIDSLKGPDSVWVYQLAFVPKSKTDLLFTGKAWIRDSSFAIQRIDLGIDRRANLNFVNDFMLKQRFTEVPGQGWIKSQEARSTNIAITKRKKAKSVRIYRYLSRNDIHINEPIADTVFGAEATVLLPDYRRRTDSFWVAERHDTLTRQEGKVYFLIDSVKQTTFYKVMSKLGGVFASGYYRAGKVEFGNLYQLVSWNDLEGVRLRLNFRSNWRLSEWVNFKFFGAYGTQDKRFKYGGEIGVRLPDPKDRYHAINTSYRDDYQRFSLEPGALEYDYIYNSVLRRRSYVDLVYVRDFKLGYNREWIPNFSTALTFNYKGYQSIPGQIEFTKTLPDGTVITYDRFSVFTPILTIVATPGAKFLQTGKQKKYLKGKLPRITLNYSFSIRGFVRSDFNFHKLDLLLEERLPSPIGYTKFILTATKLFGRAPYPLLVIHPGNQSLLQEYRRFNMMLEAEFIADQQVSLLLEHHFNGFFFNKIPLWKKLQLREVFITKMALSSLDPSKVDFMDIPEGLTGLDGFYCETGFGIENILKLMRVDFMWRLTQLNKPDVQKFRVVINFQPNF